MRNSTTRNTQRDEQTDRQTDRQTTMALAWWAPNSWIRLQGTRQQVNVRIKISTPVRSWSSTRLPDTSSTSLIGNNTNNNICSWRVTTYVGKPSAVGQPTRPTQPFILWG